MSELAHKIRPAEGAVAAPAAKREVDLLYPRTARAFKERVGSPHLIDLKPRKAKEPKENRENAKRRMPAKWRLLLDERIYVKEMRHRSVSIRPRGWRDLPPKEALTLWQATSITARKFFAENPLADLTILTLFQTMLVLAWKLVTLTLFAEIQDAEKLEEQPKPEALPLPLVPIPARNRNTAAQTTGVSLHNLGGMPRWRYALGYAAVAFAVALPMGAYSSLSAFGQMKSAVIERGVQAINYLKVAEAAAQNKDFSGAETAFGLASQEFRDIKDRLGALTGILSAASSIAPSTPVSTAGLILIAGEEVSKGGAYLAAGLSELEKNLPPADRLRALNVQAERALPHLERAAEAIALMSSDALPQEYRPTIDAAKAQLPPLIESIREASNIAGFLALMMGSDQPRRYLLAFQNNAELRPTGGFIGSYALLDVSRGEIVNFEMPGGGSYDLQGSLTAKVASPKPLRLINPRWEFQDANWSPDFPTSAARLAWFYEKSGGPTVDGVIAINATVMEKLLAIAGPVEMRDYDLTLNAENFRAETQREVETDYDRELNRPKQILADLAPRMLSRLMDLPKDEYVRLARTLASSLDVRDIQVWFRDADMQNRAADLNWTGQMLPSTGDYLQIVHTNIAGQKTDTVMTETVNHDVKILADGSAVVTLTIARTHHGVRGEPYSGVRNVDYLRVYVPLGSSLIEASGFDAPDPKLFGLPDAGYEPDPIIAAIEDREVLDYRSGTRTSVENGKTVFGNWVQTDPGETSEVRLVYQIPLETIDLRLPQNTALSAMYARLTNGAENRRIGYRLLVQKQSGTNPLEFRSSVDMPRGYRTVEDMPKRETDERGREVAAATITNDAEFILTAEAPLSR